MATEDKEETGLINIFDEAPKEKNQSDLKLKP